MMKLCIVIPAYNEEESLRETLPQLFQNLKDSKYQKFLSSHSPIVEADIDSLYQALEQQVSSWTPPHHTHWIQKHHHISAYSKLLQEIWIG